MLLLDKILGVGDAFNAKRFVKLANRDKLSAYLPYQAWDGDTNVYHSADDTFGYVWECTPWFTPLRTYLKTSKGASTAVSLSAASSSS
jgi:hypothetical protein